MSARRRIARLGVGLALVAASTAGAQSRWAVRTADAVMRRSPGAVYEKWDYTAGLVLLAMERLGGATHDPRYAAYVKRSVDSLVHADGSIATYDAEEFNLDQINEGRALFSLLDRTHDARYARAADRLR